MIKILSTLLIVRLRKILPKDDYTAIALLLLVYVSLYCSLHYYFDVLKSYILVFSLEILFYHTNRNDLELLKLHTNFKRILFLEYMLYSSPILAVIFLNNWVYGLLYMILIFTYINLPKINNSVIKYPFQLFDPFWHICFRKNKLLLFFPVSIFFAIVGTYYNNNNLIIASIVIASIIAGMPAFKREFVEHIKNSGYKAEKYIYKQFKTSLINTLFIMLPLMLTLVVLQKWDFALYALLIFIFPLVNIVYKYACFYNTFLHQLFVMLSFGFIYLAVPFILFPFLLHKSIKNVKLIQNV